MENLLLNLNIKPEISEIIAYCSSELFLILGIILNIFFFLFFKRKLNVKRISDFITCSIFILNTIIISSIFIKNSFFINELNLSILNNIVTLNKTELIIKLLVSVFMIIFMTSSYKLTRKARFKTPIINSILLLITLSVFLLIQSQNLILMYLLLDLTTIFIYKYASNMRIRKNEIYSSDFVAIGTCASILFFAFFILTLFIKDSIQLNIIHLCMALAIFLKIGIFPFVNYLINKNYKDNIPYSILLFCFLPWIGVLTFNKISNFISYSDEICQITLITFLTITTLYFGITASKQKNLIKFLANTNYFLTCFCLLNIMFLSTNDQSIKYSTLIAFCFLGLYSLLSIVKINSKTEKINIAAIKGIFFNNRLFAVLFSTLILMLVGIVPNGILKYSIEILHNVYIYDKLSFITVITIIVCYILVLLNSLKIIQNIYSFNFKKIKEKYTKRTTPNYVVPVVILIFLITSLIL